MVGLAAGFPSPHAASAQALFLQAIDLDDLAVLDDHADLAEANAADGGPDPLEVEVARGDRENFAVAVPRWQDFFSHERLALFSVPRSRPE
jgi:hypothetical protein